MTLKERYEKEIEENDRRSTVSTMTIAVALAISVIFLFPSPSQVVEKDQILFF